MKIISVNSMKFLLLWLCLATSFSSFTRAQTIIFSDNFNTATATSSGADSVTSSVSTYYKHNTTNPLQITTDPVTGSMSLAMLNVNDTARTGFTSQNLNIGDSLKLSFSLRMSTAPTGVASLRLGLLNVSNISGGPYSQGSTAANQAYSQGFFANINVGVADTNNYYVYQDQLDSTWNSTSGAAIGSGTLAQVSSGSTNTNYSFNLTRTGNNTWSVEVISGVTSLGISTFAADDANFTITSFNALTIGVMTGSASYIDNISVSFTAIPEPGTYALLFIGMAGLLGVAGLRSKASRAGFSALS